MGREITQGCESLGLGIIGGHFRVCPPQAATGTEGGQGGASWAEGTACARAQRHKGLCPVEEMPVLEGVADQCLTGDGNGPGAKDAWALAHVPLLLAMTESVPLVFAFHLLCCTK